VPLPLSVSASTLRTRSAIKSASCVSQKNLLF
jgi:hypothetical protein